MKRYSYASIERKRHPKVESQIFDFEEPIKKTGIDKEIVTKILNSFAFKIRDQKNDGTGEWEWLQNNKQKNFIKAISDMDIQGVSDFLINMFKSEATYGYLSPSFQDCKNKLSTVKSDKFVKNLLKIGDIRKKATNNIEITGNNFLISSISVENDMKKTITNINIKNSIIYLSDLLNQVLNTVDECKFKIILVRLLKKNFCFA